MKQIIISLVFLLCLGCETTKEIGDSVDKLKFQRKALQSEVTALKEEDARLRESLSQVKEELKYNKAIKDGVEVRYVLRVKLKQSHFSLDVAEHIKDAANAVEFEIPVDKQFYDSVERGTEIVDEFRTGSLIINGSFGSWHIKILDKRIAY